MTFKELIDQMYDQESHEYMEKELSEYQKEFSELSKDSFFGDVENVRTLSEKEIKVIVEEV